MLFCRAEFNVGTENDAVMAGSDGNVKFMNFFGGTSKIQKLNYNLGIQGRSVARKDLLLSYFLSCSASLMQEFPLPAQILSIEILRKAIFSVPFTIKIHKSPFLSILRLIKIIYLSTTSTVSSLEISTLE